MADDLVVHFNQNAWPLAAGIEVAAAIADSGRSSRFIFAGHAVPERGLFLPVPRLLSRALRVRRPEPESVLSESLTAESLLTWSSAGALRRRATVTGWESFLRDRNWTSLEAVTVDGLPAGRAVANYIVRRAGTRRVRLDDKAARLQFLLLAYREAAELTSRLIDEHRPTRVHAYQGNWLNDRAVIDVAVRDGIDHSTYGEAGKGRYWTWDRDPYLLQSWSELDVWSRWRTFADSMSDAELNLAIEALVRVSAEPMRNPFSTAGNIQSVPDRNLSPYVVFYTANSSDERFGLDKAWEPLWPDQVDFAVQLARVLDRLGIRLIVRVHPNTINKPRCEQTPWKDLQRRARASGERSLTIVAAESSVDSYALAANAETAVTWGSSISIELVARGIKTVNVAPAAFDCVGAVPVVESFDEILESIHAMPVTPERRSRAASWLWFMSTLWAKEFRHVAVQACADGDYVPTFNGQSLRASPTAARLSRVWSRSRSSDTAATVLGLRYGFERLIPDCH